MEFGDFGDSKTIEIINSLRFQSLVKNMLLQSSQQQDPEIINVCKFIASK
jgi:hypothetical protein